MNETSAAPAIIVPAHCPKCRSREVTTASKVVSADSYWRCGGCGEVWNAGRRREASGYAHVRPRSWR